MFQENSIETYILSRVKQITSPGWMHETSAQTWCTGKTQRDRVEREVGGGIRMGNTCKPMADSFQCMTKPTTIKKKKKKSLHLLIPNSYSIPLPLPVPLGNRSGLCVYKSFSLDNFLFLPPPSPFCSYPSLLKMVTE